MPKGSSLSSDDKEQLKGLRSVLVPPDQILSGMTLQARLRPQVCPSCVAFIAGRSEIYNSLMQC